MPPVTREQLQAKIKGLIDNNDVLVFSKTTCPFCIKTKNLFDEYKQAYKAYELDKEGDGPDIQKELKEMTNQSTVPNTFINGKHIGGYDDISKLHQDNKLKSVLKLKRNNYDYDLVVIGGGSGGLAASKEAANYGAKVLLLDFVEPTPLGTSWGIGGTCVNVGCIPKKLMHQAAILGHSLEDAKAYGWNVPDKVNHTWATMVEEIQNHIGSLNWGYRVQLREKKVTYMNAFGTLKDAHTVLARDRTNNVKEITTDKVLIATGERPKYLGIPGDKEYCITSDDLFSLSYCPGKTLVVGASYVALECAGFLTALGLDATVMVRSILLRGFDQQMANLIGDYMKAHGTKFIRDCIPTKIEELKPSTTSEPGRYKVTAKKNSGELITDEYDTILLAIGRDPCTIKLGLKDAKVELDKNNRIICNDNDQSNVPNIYAIGDMVHERPQLTPVAIQAGKLLSQRLYGDGKEKTDYNTVPTTVFTPLEYGAIGLSEEDAIAKYGEENIEVYHSNFKPLEWTVAHREDNACYCKLICNKNDSERVVGFHVLGPDAGEMTQGYAVAIKMGATKHDFDRTIGIHPTCSETFTTLNITKSSGESSEKTGC